MTIRDLLSLLSAFLQKHGIHLEAASAVSSLYQTHPDTLPPPHEWHRLAVHTVNLLAGYKRPADDARVQDFASSCANVSRMLPLVWGRSEATDGIQQALKAFYAIISTEDSYCKPSCALLNVIDKVPRAFLDMATHTILEESGQQQGEAKTVIGLRVGLIISLSMERIFIIVILPDDDRMVDYAARHHRPVRVDPADVARAAEARQELHPH